MKISVKVFFLLCTMYYILCTISSADTIRMKDGKEMKGIVVEDYRDRLTFSTADGELTVMKSGIRELYFDSEEDNLIKLAEQAKERRDYARSFAYYDMAAKINPDSKAAKDGLVFLQGYLFRMEEVKKEEDIKRREKYERYGTVYETTKSGEDAVKEGSEKLKGSLGVNIRIEKGLPKIENVRKGSPAYEAGVREGDLLVAVWGRLTGYMPLKEVLAVLLDKPSLELKCTIERTVEVGVNPDGSTGGLFSMEFDGLTVSGVKEDSPAFKAGLEKGDLIVAIDENSTRYMPLKKAHDLIRASKDKSVKLTLRRDMTIWRRD